MKPTRLMSPTEVGAARSRRPRPRSEADCLRRSAGLLSGASRLTVENYRALRDVTIPLSRFGCLIGENNSGKSAFLQAMTLFFSGSPMAPHNFFNETKPIRIVVVEGVTINCHWRLTGIVSCADGRQTRIVVGGPRKAGQIVVAYGGLLLSVQTRKASRFFT